LRFLQAGRNAGVAIDCGFGATQNVESSSNIRWKFHLNQASTSRETVTDLKWPSYPSVRTKRSLQRSGTEPLVPKTVRWVVGVDAREERAYAARTDAKRIG
jgi:hypothetical protein